MASTILFIDHTAELGGGELALLEIVRGLDRLRFHPVVLLGAEGPLAEQLRAHCEVLVFPLPATVSGVRISQLGQLKISNLRALAASLRYVRRLQRAIQRVGPGIVYTNSLKADLLGGIAGRLCRRPVVWHVRDRIAPDYLPRPVVTIFRWLCRWIPTHVVGCSQSVLDCLCLPESKPRCVVYSGVRTTAYEEMETEQEGHDVAQAERSTIGLVGRLAPWKGQRIFIEAAAKVHVCHPNAKFVLYGRSMFGDEEYEHALRNQVADLHLEDVVELRGFQRDVVRAMQELDIVVHASTIPEPFGQVIVQGMAAMKPVIATQGGGVNEIITDGQDGVLVPRSDSAALADAIGTLLDCPEKAAELVRAARERVRSCFTIEHTLARISSLFESIVRIRPHVLLYNMTSRVSGAEISLLNIVQRWNRDLLDLSVVCPEGDLAKRLRGMQLPPTPIGELRARYTSNPLMLCRYMGSILRSAAELRRTLRKVRPNLIHANSLRAGIVSALASLGMKTKVQWHVHDNLPRHVIAHAVRMLALLSRKSRFLWVSSATRANFCGKAFRNALARRGSVLMNAIEPTHSIEGDAARFAIRQELGIEDEVFCIGHVGQISPRKDQAGAIRAFARMLKKIPDAVLLVVGSPVFDAGIEYLEEISQLARELGVAERVRFLGQRSDVGKLLSAMDLLVLNSLSDPCPLTLLEAMHAARPILASNVDGIPELIQDGHSGWLCPAGNVAALARAMVRIARLAPAERDGVGKTAQERVRTLHSMDRYMARFLSVSRQALA